MIINDITSVNVTLSICYAFLAKVQRANFNEIIHVYNLIVAEEHTMI